MLADSLGFTLGIPIHQVVWQNRNQVRVNAFRWLIIKQGLSGTRSLPEAMDIFGLLASVHDESIEKIELSDKNVVRQRTEPDGTSVSYFEPALLDRFMQMTELAVWKEAAKNQVAVVNATGKPQMAFLWSRLPRFSGYDVASVTDQPESVQQTTIVFNDSSLLHQPLGQALHYLFPRASITIGDTNAYRANIAVIVGTDSWEWLNHREAYLQGIGKRNNLVREAGKTPGMTY